MKETPKMDFNEGLKQQKGYDSGDNVSLKKEEEIEEYGAQEDS